MIHKTAMSGGKLPSDEFNPNPNFTDQILKAISDSTKELFEISDKMNGIANKKKSFLDIILATHETEDPQNIKDIAQHVAKLTKIQKTSLDLIVLIMGAAGTMKADYNIIINSIEELSKQHGGSVEVLDYLVKIKRMVIDLQKRDVIIQDLVKNTQTIQTDVLSVGSSTTTALKLAQEFTNDSAILKKNFSSLCIKIENAHGEVHNTNSLLAETQQKAEKEMAILRESTASIQIKVNSLSALFRNYLIGYGILCFASLLLAIYSFLS
jgi:hypothetical protein